MKTFFVEIIPMDIAIVFDPFTLLCILLGVVLVTLAFATQPAPIKPTVIEEDLRKEIPESIAWQNHIDGIPPKRP